MRGVHKALRFPLGGLARNLNYRDTTYPSEDRVYSAPMALNVIGECAFSSRLRGGSRPGMKRVDGLVPPTELSGKWKWPNGESILWTANGFTQWSASGEGLPERWRILYSPGDEYPWRMDQWNAEWGAWELFLFSHDDVGEDAMLLHFGDNIIATREHSNVLSVVYPKDGQITMPDGSVVIDQHERFTVRATKGNAPSEVDAIAMYRDRLVVAKDSMWYASRTGDYGDFDYGGDAEDVTRAVAGSVALAGRKGERITSLIPICDERLYVATNRQIRIISEEPTSGSEVISEVVGIISRDAWCSVDGAVYFMSQKGLCSIGDGVAMLVSSQIPEDLRGLDSAVLIYDPSYRGIHIIATRGEGNAAVRKDYFYDVEKKSFWPLEYSPSVRPVSGGMAVVGNENRVVFKCADGVLRYWDNSQKQDDGYGFLSMVAIGPFRCGAGDDTDGMLDGIMATTGEGSDAVAIDVYSGSSAEKALLNAESAAVVPQSTASFRGGWNYKWRPRVRGAWCVLIIKSMGKWAYESILAYTKILGGLRNV